MRRHLKLPLVVVAAFDRADVPVVSRFFVRSGERKRRFQIRFTGLPIDDVAKLDSIPAVACRQAHRLLKLRPFCFAHYFDRHTRRTVFNYAHVRNAADVRARRLLLIGPVHVPRGPLRGRIVLYREANRSFEQVAVQSLVKDAGDVAV